MIDKAIRKFFFLTHFQLNDGNWHFICATWENKAGSWEIFIADGYSKADGKGLQTGHVIKTDGLLILGQEQDSFGGGFASNQNYVGLLTDLNIWDSVLSKTEILNLSKTCHAGWVMLRNGRILKLE